MTLTLQAWVLRATHILIKVNISARSFQNPSRNGKVMDRTLKKALWPLWHWPWYYRHNLCARHIASWWLNFLSTHFKIHYGITKLWAEQNVHMHTYIHTYIHIYTTYIHTYIHLYMYIQTGLTLYALPPFLELRDGGWGGGGHKKSHRSTP